MALGIDPGQCRKLPGNSSLMNKLSWCGIMLSVLLAGCSGLPKQQESVSYRFSAEQVDYTSLSRSVAALKNGQQPGHSGLYPLVEADEAFAARMLLAKHAERSLDIQYYIWRADMTGLMLLDAVYQAANRGVRVRILLDDNNSAQLEPYLLALQEHPNVQVRVFNPFVIRNSRWRWLGYITDFKRVNRRMHNKSFTADSAITIVGGRNIGDSYFGADDDVLFADLDVISVGEVVSDVADDFDRYWNSVSAYKLARISKGAQRIPLQQLSEQAQRIAREGQAQNFVESLRSTDLICALLHGPLEFKWAPIQMVSDEPAKVLSKEKKEKVVTSQLQRIIGDPQHEVELVSPYFVPTKSVVRSFSWLEREGVHVKVLTNSLAATDVSAVHSGYSKRRKAMLKAGIELYELRASRQSELKPKGRKERKENKSRLLGVSGSSLHAKTFSVDGRQVFVGSFNFDPRSALYNTELGFVIESPELAERIRRAFIEEVPQQAFEVRLNQRGRLYWVERNGDVQTIHTSEPRASLRKRLAVRFFSWLPIDSLL